MNTLPKPADSTAPTFDAELYAETIASVAKMAAACGVPPDFRRMWFDAETELIRHRAIEDAAREVLASGQARYKSHTLSHGQAMLSSDDVWLGDLVPAAAMAALRAAVEGEPAASTPPPAPVPDADAGGGTTEAGWMRLVNDLLTRAEAAEAERDRLRAEVAALRGAIAEAIASYREWLYNDIGSEHVTDRHGRAMIGLRAALAATSQPVGTKVAALTARGEGEVMS